MKNLSLIYIIALSIIALVIGASQYLVQRSIATSIYDSRTINISGRQSMLSQKIAKSALGMETARNESEFNNNKVELAEASDLWETSHNALQYGNDAMELNNVNNSEQTLLYFLELERHYVAMKDAVDNLLEFKYDSAGISDELITQVDVILKNEPSFLDLMNQITLDYDNESRARVSELSKTEYVLVGIAYLLLILEGLLIFRPVINRVVLYTKRLVRQEESLKRALKQQRKEKAKVDYLNRQARSVFQNVRQGLFLIDKNMNVAELYSKALEEIFDQKHLAGKSFLDLMKPRLLKRNQEALEMFVKHLFNPDIEEDVLAQLNPVENVDIYYNRSDASIETRYITVSFARIGDESKILTVLVTITDETEQVLMQRKINETEERNKRESAQILSILKVNPRALQDFLQETQQTLQGISERYETDQNANLQELISFTFNTIHNLKGNATLIDLDLMADKLHEIENVIVGLRDNDELASSDFLKILYEINEVNQIVVNMQSMLVRIAEVNNEISTGEYQGDNTSFATMLQRGVEKLQKEMKKEVQFKFRDNGFAIPDHYRVPLKDVFIQLLRNSMAHGIESAEDRVAVGKSRVATVALDIRQQKNDLIVSYMDDGQGLNSKKILTQAISRNLITKEEAEKMTAEDVVKLIFKDGFSTSNSVDKYSGRGQGMSLVKDLITRNNGKYKISAKKGKMFRLDFVLPMDTEIIEAI